MAVRFKGYAVVSADGFIADECGSIADTLRFETGWAYFQAALDAADITLLGRHTHEAASNFKGRRLVVSRGVRAVIQEDASTWWANPREVVPASAVAVAAGTEASVAVVGGTGVFGWILEEGAFEEFHLSIARNLRFGTGRRLFDHVDDLDGVIAALEANGLKARPRAKFDEQEALELLILERSPA